VEAYALEVHHLKLLEAAAHAWDRLVEPSSAYGQTARMPRIATGR
jgi:hypothetical protein